MPQTPIQGIKRSVLLRPSPTQPSLPRNPPQSTRPSGPHARPNPGGMRPGRGRQIRTGDEVYLWILVGLEVLFVGGMRKVFKRYHGG